MHICSGVKKETSRILAVHDVVVRVERPENKNLIESPPLSKSSLSTSLLISKYRSIALSLFSLPVSLPA